MNSPDWELTGDTIERFRAELSSVDESTRADFDEFAGFVGDRLAEYGIAPSRDEWAVYHGLAFTSLLADLARNNYENGAIDEPTARTVAAIAHSVALVLAQHAPD